MSDLWMFHCFRCIRLPIW